MIDLTDRLQVFDAYWKIQARHSEKWAGMYNEFNYPAHMDLSEEEKMIADAYFEMNNPTDYMIKIPPGTGIKYL